MSKFPTTEADVLVLANDLTNGFANHIDIYPAPPVEAADLSALSSSLIQAQVAMTEAKAAAEAATAAKVAALEAMADAMKKDIRYAENTVNYDDEKLKLLGWSGRKDKTPMAVPGQTRELVAVEQGEGWVKLAWKKPVDGGAVSVYKVQRRQRPEGSWQETAASIERQITLTDQLRGVEWEYRIIAANKAGDGMGSNIVLAVL